MGEFEVGFDRPQEEDFVSDNNGTISLVAKTILEKYKFKALNEEKTKWGLSKKYFIGIKKGNGDDKVLVLKKVRRGRNPENTIIYRGANFLEHYDFAVKLFYYLGITDHVDALS